MYRALLPPLLPRQRDGPSATRAKRPSSALGSGAEDGTRTRTGLPPAVFKAK
jgi:hypothetical protein